LDFSSTHCGSGIGKLVKEPPREKKKRKEKEKKEKAGEVFEA
jgi:hypothetical protein